MELRQLIMNLVIQKKTHMSTFLRFVPKSSAAVPIDWSKVPEKSKQYFLKVWARNPFPFETPIEERSLPQTIGGLAESFHERKFISYFGPELCQLLLDISEFGLQPENFKDLGLPVGPRFYVKSSYEVWFVLFAPGEKEGAAAGFSDELPCPDVEDEDAEAEKDREVAEKFDKKRLAGWEANTLENYLKEAQLADAMLSLPSDHPAAVGYMRNVFASLRRR